MRVLILLFASAVFSMRLFATAVNEVSHWRMSFSGVGRFGSEMSLIDTPLNKKHELYGGSVDVMYNLLAGQHFNFWIGLGSTYMPEQEVGSYSISGRISRYALSYDEWVNIEAYDLRIMVLPEWRITPTLAFGLRLGIGACHYNGTTNESFSRVGYTSGTATSTHSDNVYSQTLFRTLLGAQLLWQFSSHLSVLAYCQAYLGDQADFELKGAKIGEFDDLSAEFGIGLTYSF